MTARTPPLPSLRELTRQLRELHEAWSHPDAGGEYVKLVCEVGEGWRVVAASMVDDLWIAYADPSEERSLLAYGREYVPGSVERECDHGKPPCTHTRAFDWPEAWPCEECQRACGVCNGSGRVHVPSSFDATAAARRLLAAARDGLEGNQ